MTTFLSDILFECFAFDLLVQTMSKITK